MKFVTIDDIQNVRLQRRHTLTVDIASDQRRR